jgi:hypothetical protein
MPWGTIVAIEGASAAGKTTVAETVARATGGTFLPEAYRRMTPPPSLEFTTDDALLALEDRLLEEDGRRYAEARRLSGNGATVIADTGFLGALSYTWGLDRLGRAGGTVLAPLLATARALDRSGRWGLADATIYLDTPAVVRLTRSRDDPIAHPPELVRRHADVGEQEREFYLERFAPLVGSRFASVSGEGSPSAVAARVTDRLRGSDSSPPPVVAVDAVLGLFEDERGRSRRGRGNR